MVTFASELQFLNVAAAILVTPEGIAMLLRLVQSRNASCSIVVSVSGRFIDSRDEQLLNA